MTTFRTRKHPSLRIAITDDKKRPNDIRSLQFEMKDTWETVDGALQHVAEGVLVVDDEKDAEFIRQVNAKMVLGITEDAPAPA